MGKACAGCLGSRRCWFCSGYGCPPAQRSAAGVRRMRCDGDGRCALCAADPPAPAQREAQADVVVRLEAREGRVG